MDSAAIISASPRRAEAISEIDSGSIFFQPNRLDVLVHLLALERLAGVDGSATGSADWVDSVDWVALSDAFAAADNEPTMASIAADLLTSPTPDLTVTFASGGQLVRGAGAAAAAMYSNTSAVRVDGAAKVADRSITALQEAGWSVADCRSLLFAWVLRDAAATVVLIDLDAPSAADAEHELRCRFTMLHSETDHLSILDGEAVGSLRDGSTQVLLLRADDKSLAPVIERHDNAVSYVAHQGSAATVLESLWDVDRAASTSPAHGQRLRRQRREALVSQLLERMLGR